MYYEYNKQHKILEEIFEYVINQGRKDLIDAYHDAAGTKYTTKATTARKKWKCTECKKAILPGEKYVNQTKTEGKHSQTIFLIKHICKDCFEKTGDVKKPHVGDKTKSNKFKFIKES
jgi:RNase P subunit RPR2